MTGNAAGWRVYALPSPPSVNTLTFNRGGRGGRGKTPEYRAWRDWAALTLRKQHPAKIAGPYELRLEISRKRKGDLGNYEKSVSDILQACGIVENDRLAERLIIEWHNGLQASAALVSLRPFVAGAHV